MTNWYLLASNMLGCYGDIDLMHEYPETHSRLQNIDLLCSRVGGKLISRQLIATIILMTNESNKEREHGT